MTTSVPPDALERLRQRAAGLEAQQRWSEALQAYEAALLQAPDDPGIVSGLARIALQLDMAEQALALWRQAASLAPQSLEAVDGQGRALAALERYGEAVDTLRAAILAHPHEARLWNTLGVVLTQQGESETAFTFFGEAVSLEPGFAAALYNRGDARFDLGELALAEADFDAAARHAADPGQTAVIAFARALLALHRGDLGAGWDAYEARLSPDQPSAPVFEAPGEPWTPDTPLEGAHLLAIGEQGVGDEIMFASLVPDLVAALGPQGRLSLALEPRLHALARRSFPGVEVLAYATERRAGRPHRSVQAPPSRRIDLWAPLGSLPRRFRRTIESFAPRSYLTPDPGRVAHWRAWLDEEIGAGEPAIGLSWRSGLQAGRRARHAPRLTDLAPVLQAGVRVVHLQYGAGEAELAALDALAATPLLRPPDIDLRQDLDDLAALCVALDLVVSVPNATAALAAACGAETWFLTSPNAWPRLGTDGYPWYPRTRSFAAERFGAWEVVLEAAAEALQAHFASS